MVKVASLINWAIAAGYWLSGILLFGLILGGFFGWNDYRLQRRLWGTEKIPLKDWTHDYILDTLRNTTSMTVMFVIVEWLFPNLLGVNYLLACATMTCTGFSGFLIEAVSKRWLIRRYNRSLDSQE